MRRRLRPLLLAVLAGATVAGCSSAGGSPEPTWQASPPQVRGGERGGGVTPILPVPQPTGAPSSRSPGAPGGPGGSPTGSSTRGRGVDPLVVATNLTAPVGLTLLPDGTALVGERTTGRILRVQPRPGQPVPAVRTLTGLDASGDGGLLDLALSPSYAEDNLVYAYITTATDNRVVDFTLRGPVTPVLTGIPKGRTGNTGRIMFGRDGDLYVGTGDAGRPALAQNPNSLAGKVLRVDPIGDVPRGNPHAGSPVWSTGHRQVDGLCTSSDTPVVFEVESGPTDEVNRIVAGDDGGFPEPRSTSSVPASVLPDAYRAPGGCAVLDGRLWITSLDGRALVAAALSPAGGTVSVGRFEPALVKRYGRLRTVVAAPDGALWLTTSNRDGKGNPVATDERVIRYLSSSSSSSSPA